MMQMPGVSTSKNVIAVSFTSYCVCVNKSVNISTVENVYFAITWRAALPSQLLLGEVCSYCEPYTFARKTLSKVRFV